MGDALAAEVPLGKFVIFTTLRKSGVRDRVVMSRHFFSLDYVFRPEI